MRTYLGLFAAILVARFAVGCDAVHHEPIVVNSLEDVAEPPEGVVTLRSALASAASGQPIIFDESLDGGIIELSIVGNPHTVLKGEVMGMRDEPSGPVSYLVGYFDRDYGRSALYARKTVVIDASSLPSGITVAWTGGEANPARVLAVRGNLSMVNVSITGGWSVAEELPPPDPNDENGQLSTRARGAGIAVWGIAKLEDCRLYNNHGKRDASVPARSRDAGVFGGGIYADIVDMDNCVVSGNSVSASGVSGGGVFSVGGAEASRQVSKIRRSAIHRQRHPWESSPTAAASIPTAAALGRPRRWPWRTPPSRGISSRRCPACRRPCMRSDTGVAAGSTCPTVLWKSKAARSLKTRSTERRARTTSANRIWPAA